jgi:hypothetical protein
MGFGSFLKDTFDSATTFGSLFGGGAPDRQTKAQNARNRAAAFRRGEITREQLLAGNVSATLKNEELKDLLVNNPNIVGPGGSQFFDVETNTIRLEESPFQKEQRLRQENLAKELFGSLSGALPSTDNELVRQATFDQGKSLLDPTFKEDRRRLEQQLADQGLPPGSEAFNEQLNRLEQSQGQQLQQLSLGSVLQGIQTAEAQRQARYNEIASLLGQAQLGGVGFDQFQPRASGVDIVGLGEAQRNRDFQRSANNQASRDARFAAIGQVVGAGFKAFSDAKLKTNIEIVGQSNSGIPIVEFDYIDPAFGEGRYRGVLAQDIQDKYPEAVIMNEEKDCLMVKYDLIDVDFVRLNHE